MKTLLGTSADELIKGSLGRDSIDGGGGNDTIYGYWGRDTLYGGDGDDRILTGSGPDVAYGGDGDDVIIDTWTKGGVEALHGGAGNDVIRALFSDTLGPYGARSEWWMFGDAGNDKLIAAIGGESHLYGGSGRDVLIMSSYGGGEAFGGGGNDVLLSEERSRINEPASPPCAEHDPGALVTLHGGRGNDVMYGYGANSGTFVFKPGDGRDVIKNFGIGPLFGGDSIDLSAFEFDMTAEEVYETYAFERDDRIILNFGSDGRLVIHEQAYEGLYYPELTPPLTAQHVIDALIL